MSFSRRAAIRTCCVCAAGAFFFSACSKTTPPVSSGGETAQPRPTAGAGTVSGTTTPPQAGRFVVVTLEPRSERAFAPQAEIPVMDQIGQTFGPELLFVRTGQPVEFRNSDDTLHNVHVAHQDTHEPAFNVAIPTGEKYSYTFTHDGFYHVGCDIHPAMSATIFAAPTPFATLASADGSFVFTDVPFGPWRVTVLTGTRRLERDVDVSAGTATVAVE